MATAGGSGATAGGSRKPPAVNGAAYGRHIDAFTLEDVLEDKRVVCLEAWSQYILIGLSGRPQEQPQQWCSVLAAVDARLPTNVALTGNADGTLVLASQRRRIPSSSSLAASDSE